MIELISKYLPLKNEFTAKVDYLIKIDQEGNFIMVGACGEFLSSPAKPTRTNKVLPYYLMDKAEYLILSGKKNLASQKAHLSLSENIPEILPIVRFLAKESEREKAYKFIEAHQVKHSNIDPKASICAFICEDQLLLDLNIISKVDQIVHEETGNYCPSLKIPGTVLAGGKLILFGQKRHEFAYSKIPQEAINQKQLINVCNYINELKISKKYIQLSDDSSLFIICEDETTTDLIVDSLIFLKIKDLEELKDIPVLLVRLNGSQGRVALTGFLETNSTRIMDRIKEFNKITRFSFSGICSLVNYAAAEKWHLLTSIINNKHCGYSLISKNLQQINKYSKLDELKFNALIKLNAYFLKDYEIA